MTGPYALRASSQLRKSNWLPNRRQPVRSEKARHAQATVDMAPMVAAARPAALPASAAAQTTARIGGWAQGARTGPENRAEQVTGMRRVAHW
jgi:hypothetical protein